MPAFAKLNPGQLFVVFKRDGKEVEQQIAKNGMTAVSVAMQMLMLREELRPGDGLIVLQEAIASSGPSPGDAPA